MGSHREADKRKVTSSGQISKSEEWPAATKEGDDMVNRMGWTRRTQAQDIPIFMMNKAL
jgi:hypothetical protein